MRKKRRSPKPLMDFDRRMANRLGSGYTFEEVPISQIEQRKTWNEFRFADNLKKIKASGKMPPVFLYSDERKLKLQIEDGIHRINVAKKLGFTHVPAIVARTRGRRH